MDFEHYSRGIITFPLIGLLLGAISGLVFMVLQAWCGAPDWRHCLAYLCWC
ncbi:hypothetical protein ACLBOM_16000 [Escherichia coli]